MNSNSFPFYILIRTLKSSELMPSLLTKQKTNHSDMCSKKLLHFFLRFSVRLTFLYLVTVGLSDRTVLASGQWWDCDIKHGRTHITPFEALFSLHPLQQGW